MSEKSWRELLSLAIEVAQDAHRDQVDKNGKPYWGHLIRVAAQMRPDNVAAQIVAILHDVVEDSGGRYTLQNLEDQYGFPPRIIAALDAISHRKPDETHTAYIERCRRDPLATLVKKADLLDNLHPQRRYEGDEGLQRRYRKALERLAEPYREIDAPFTKVTFVPDPELTAYLGHVLDNAAELTAVPAGPMNEPEPDENPF